MAPAPRRGAAPTHGYPDTSHRIRWFPSGGAVPAGGDRGAVVLRQERDERGVVTLTLDRPDVRNALDPALIDALAGAVGEIGRDGTARVVVLTGAGEAFCAGADLRWFRAAATSSHEEGVAESRRLHDLLVALDSLPQPVVARVNGAAFGGALGLIACADVAVAATGATFAFSEVRLGLAPAVVSPFVVRRIGTGRARRWFLTGERFGAAAALDAGLVHEVSDDLDAGVETLVTALLRGGPHAQAAVKDLLRNVSQAADPESVAPLTTALIARLRASDEGQEGMAAFLERRYPRWSPPDA